MAPPQGLYAGEFAIGDSVAKRTQKYCATGEFRPPKQGELYLSGAIIAAYRAPNDLSQPYFIAKAVTLKPCPHCHGTGQVISE